MAVHIAHSAPIALFDLRASVENLELNEIVKRYEKSDRSLATAKSILKSFKTSGTVSISDASGLSKLTATMPLVEAMALVQEPKEAVYSLGKGLGGFPVGTWAADNTSMFYGEKIRVSDVVRLHEEIIAAHTGLTVKLGFGIHSGEFYRIGGGLYGNAFETIDDIAENHTAGGEIAVSEASKRSLETEGNPYGFAFSKKENEWGGFDAFKVASDFESGKTDVVHELTYHPLLPFPFRFYQAIGGYSSDRDLETLLRKTRRYSVEKYVALLQARKDDYENDEVGILARFAFDHSLRKLSRATAKHCFGTEIKTGSGMSIVLFDSPAQAVRYSLEMREALSEKNVECSVGIEEGGIFSFKMGKRLDVAGGAVNVASKLAQDLGKPGEILLTERFAAKLPGLSGKPFELTASGVALRGIGI